MRSIVCSGIAVLLAVFSGVSDVECAAKSKSTSDAVEYSGIVAIINDEIVTSYDLENRVRLVMLSIGDGVTADMKAKIYTEVLEEIVNEKLKTQCTKKYTPKGGWMSKKEMNDAVKDTVQDMAKQINKSPEEFLEFLESKGINFNVIKSQIEANLCWVEYIKARFGKNINISESELNRIYATVKEKFTKESYYVHRMFFPFSKPSEEAAIASHANNLLNMLKNGAEFGSVARQFSKSADAKRGGELGWIFQGQLSPEEESTLKGMSIGSYAIAKSSKGYFLLYLHDKRESGVRSLTDLDIVQVIMPFQQKNPSSDVIGPLMDYVNDLMKKSNGAKDLVAKAKESGMMMISDVTHCTLESMQPQFRNMLSDVQQDCFSKPMLVDGGIVVVCVMDRKVTTLKEPSRDEIKYQKTSERLTVFAERELQDLKKKAVINIDAKYGRRH
ncbi:chaperone SurA [Alphaproteobacteria bacterium]|nr:chaperone SurA [Alphaproteobacteria bacterium]